MKVQLCITSILLFSACTPTRTIIPQQEALEEFEELIEATPAISPNDPIDVSDVTSDDRKNEGEIQPKNTETGLSALIRALTGRIVNQVYQMSNNSFGAEVLTMDVQDQKVRLKKVIHKFQGEGFKIVIEDQDGNLNEIMAPDYEVYQGYSALGDAIMIRVDQSGRVSGMIIESNGERKPIASTQLEEKGVTTFYSYDEPSPDRDFECGVKDEPQFKFATQGATGASTSTQPQFAQLSGSSLLSFNILYMTDDSMLNNLFQGDVDQMIDYIIDAHLKGTMVRQRDLGLTNLIAAIYISNADPINGASGYFNMINTFTGIWQNDPYRTFITGMDVNASVFLTDQSLGGPIGIAWVGGICASFLPGQETGTYAVVQSFNTAYGWIIMAHEIGHIQGLNHCLGPGCEIMKAALDPAADEFGPQSQLATKNLLGSYGCFENASGGVSLPFVSSFPSSSSVNHSLWVRSEPSYTSIATNKLGSQVLRIDPKDFSATPQIDPFVLTQKLAPYDTAQDTFQNESPLQRRVITAAMGGDSSAQNTLNLTAHSSSKFSQFKTKQSIGTLPLSDPSPKYFELLSQKIETNTETVELISDHSAAGSLSKAVDITKFAVFDMKAELLKQQHTDDIGAVADVGDVNANGHADFLVGRPTENGTGSFSIYDGGDFTRITKYDHPYPGNLGFSATKLGDINYDGRDDFAVGSPANDQVIVFDGASLSPIHTIQGPNLSEYGYSITNAGLLASGSTTANLAIGAPSGNDPNGVASGFVELVSVMDYVKRGKYYGRANRNPGDRFGHIVSAQVRNFRIPAVAIGSCGGAYAYALVENSSGGALIEHEFTGNGSEYGCRLNVGTYTDGANVDGPDAIALGSGVPDYSVPTHGGWVEFFSLEPARQFQALGYAYPGNTDYATLLPGDISGNRYSNSITGVRINDPNYNKSCVNTYNSARSKLETLSSPNVQSIRFAKLGDLDLDSTSDIAIIDGKNLVVMSRNTDDFSIATPVADGTGDNSYNGRNIQLSVDGVFERGVISNLKISGAHSAQVAYLLVGQSFKTRAQLWSASKYGFAQSGGFIDSPNFVFPIALDSNGEAIVPILIERDYPGLYLQIAMVDDDAQGVQEFRTSPVVELVQKFPNP